MHHFVPFLFLMSMASTAAIKAKGPRDYYSDPEEFDKVLTELSNKARKPDHWACTSNEQCKSGKCATYWKIQQCIPSNW